MTTRPGRMALITQAAFDTRLGAGTITCHLNIALPKGYDRQRVDQVLEDARTLRAGGKGHEAALLLQDLITKPPMQEARNG